MFKVNNSYCITLHKNKLKVFSNNLNQGTLPIVWMNNGQYGLIVREKIKNVIQFFENDKKLHPLNPILASYTFHWSEVLLLPPAIGEQLFSKQSNQ